MEFTIEKVNEGRSEICKQILRGLPQWFAIESSIQNYVHDVESLETFVAFSAAKEPIGFVSLKIHNENNAEVYVMGVLPPYHGKGIGRKLMDEAFAFARQRLVRFLTVKTLSPSRPDLYYSLTRKFYYSVGFVALEEFPSLWDKANPCLLMIKNLQSPEFKELTQNSSCRRAPHNSPVETDRLR